LGKFGVVKKVIRFLLSFLAFLVVVILTFAIIGITRVDRTSYRDQTHYSDMMNQLDGLKEIMIPKATSPFMVGSARENLTPPFRTATAGYGNRKGRKFTTVHDSLWVRAIVISNGSVEVAVVSADLLIIPPEVTNRLSVRLPEIGFSIDNTFLNATHTHNSIGNWGEGVAGFLYGFYDDKVVDFITDKVVAAISAASRNRIEASLKTGSIMVSSAVRHRIVNYGEVDSLLHVVEFNRADSTSLVIVSYNAHATCLYSKDLGLSRDYPGKLVDDLESQGYHFAMYLSGAVGSHGCNPPEYGEACIGWMADEIVMKFNEAKPSMKAVEETTLMMIRLPLHIGEPQFKIARDWRLRPWVFDAALGRYQAYLTGLRLGNILLFGTPCDFSGELSRPVRAAAARKGLHAIITSFNGHYIGYITRDEYYDHPHYETRLMNWYGPGNGAYFTECLEGMVDILHE
jgi:neutral ceramidase